MALNANESTTSPPGEELLRLEGISKSFPGVKALDNVRLDVRKGEVHALLGENGAGKSTLMKILSGAYTRDSGEIYWEGRPIEIHNPKAAQDLGIGIIYQEFNLIPQLSIAENVWIGREPLSNPALRLIDWTELYRRTAELLAELHLDLDPRRLVAGLGVAQQQMVEIAKALSLNTKLLIMDEPTSALTEREVERLFTVIRRLKGRGVGVVFISHHLDEVKKICDRGTVLRDGAYVKTLDLAGVSEDQIIRLMVGRALDQQYPKVPARRGQEALRVEGLRRRGVLLDTTVEGMQTSSVLDGVSFSAYTGEILGIAGLVGAGRTELMRCVFGADPIDAGRIEVFGKEHKISSPKAAIELGLGLLPEDRKLQGLVLKLSVRENIALASLKQLVSRFLLRLKDEGIQADQYVQNLRIRTPGTYQQVQFLSGGNQQKVVLAKWLASRSKILIFDEPTRGIDVGAKVEVYNLMNNLVEQGVAVIMVSSEMPELLGMSDRILVMHKGRFTAELMREEATQEKVLTAAMGGEQVGSY
ncbi:MAG: sugar ABC transporter ATP-binding protein [Kouleothrix sp.]|nr:sugar ABC transporter ATP-binding protein [Kouleothrix sp.]